MENLGKIFLFIGSVAGVYSFIRLMGGDILDFFNRANLVIEFNAQKDVGQWRVGPPYTQNMVNRRVVTVYVHNKGKKSASNCEAFIEINDGDSRLKRILPLHWADTEYSALSTSIERVEINQLPRRLDVAFTQDGLNIHGCCIASSQALSSGPQRDQFFLAEGEHRVAIHVNYNSGKRVAKEFIIESPNTWENLEMRIV